MEGWVRIYRQLSENKLWTSEPFSRGQAWIDLILMANHRDGYFYKRGNKVTVKRGQVGVSTRGLADRWKWSRGKVTRFLSDLEEEQQVDPRKSNVTTLLTICNYNTYQNTEPQTEPQTEPRTGHERATDGPKQECKEGKEEEIYPFSEFWSLYNKKEGKKDCLKIWSKLKSEDHKQIMERLPVWLAGHSNGRFRPYPATFLNGRRWEDDIQTAVEPEYMPSFINDQSIPAGWNPK